MTNVAPLLSLLNLAGLGGLAWFIYHVIRGLRERVQALTVLAEEQQKTLEVVRSRALELDQFRKDYRQAVDDFQDLGRKLDERRNAVISELEQANATKDSELARLKSLELEEIELKKRSFEKLPELEQTLQTTITQLQRQVRLVSGGSDWLVNAYPLSSFTCLRPLLHRSTSPLSEASNAAITWALSGLLKNAGEPGAAAALEPKPKEPGAPPDATTHSGPGVDAEKPKAG